MISLVRPSYSRLPEIKVEQATVHPCHLTQPRSTSRLLKLVSTKPVDVVENPLPPLPSFLEARFIVYTVTRWHVHVDSRYRDRSCTFEYPHGSLDSRGPLPNRGLTSSHFFVAAVPTVPYQFHRTFDPFPAWRSDSIHMLAGSWNIRFRTRKKIPEITCYFRTCRITSINGSWTDDYRNQHTITNPQVHKKKRTRFVYRLLPSACCVSLRSASHR